MSDPNDLNGGAPAGRAPRRGGPRWLLILSLALNLFVLAWAGAAALHWTGVLGGHHGGMGRHAAHWYEMRDARGDARGGGGPLGPLGVFLDDKPPQDSALAPLYARHAPMLREAFLAARDARADVRRLLREGAAAGRVDPVALERALTEVRRATAAVQAHMHAALLDAAQTLPPDRFAALIERRGDWRGDWRGRGRDD